MDYDILGAMKTTSIMRRIRILATRRRCFQNVQYGRSVESAHGADYMDLELLVTTHSIEASWVAFRRPSGAGDDPLENPTSETSRRRKMRQVNMIIVD